MDALSRLPAAARCLLPLLFVLLPSPAYGVIDCYECASPELQYNWEVTGLPTIPANNRSFFSTGDCVGMKPVPHKCQDDACFFSSYILSSGEYVVVRGCVKDFVRGTGLNVNSAVQTCEITNGNKPAIVGGEVAMTPHIGWFICTTTGPCNNFILSADVVNTVWKGPGFDCHQPEQKECISCLHFDGEGRCYHDYRHRCQGGYCVKVIGKINGRWLEYRGCTLLDPLGLKTCLTTKKTIMIDQLGMTLNQSYEAESCVCEGEVCNGGGAHSLMAVLAIVAVGLMGNMLM